MWLTAAEVEEEGDVDDAEEDGEDDGDEDSGSVATAAGNSTPEEEGDDDEDCGNAGRAGWLRLIASAKTLFLQGRYMMSCIR